MHANVNHIACASTMHVEATPLHAHKVQFPIHGAEESFNLRFDPQTVENSNIVQKMSVFPPWYFNEHD